MSRPTCSGWWASEASVIGTSSARQPRSEVVDTIGEEVDLEPELDGQPAALAFLDRGHVLVEVVAAPVLHPRHVPEGLALAEVIRVVADPDLVDARAARLLDVLLEPL